MSAQLEQDENQRRLMLYDPELTIGQNAEQFGLGYSATYDWICRNNLEHKQRGRPSLEFPDREKMYDDGYCDVCMAAATGTTTHNIWRWRRRRGYGSNHEFCPHCKERRRRGA